MATIVQGPGLCDIDRRIQKNTIKISKNWKSGTVKLDRYIRVFPFDLQSVQFRRARTSHFLYFSEFFYRYHIVPALQLVQPLWLTLEAHEM